MPLADDVRGRVTLAVARLMDVGPRDAVAVDGRCYGVGRMEDVDVGRWMLKDLMSEVAIGLDEVDFGWRTLTLMEDVNVGRWMLKDLTSEVAVGLDDVDLLLDVGGCREAVQYCRRRCGRW